MSFTYLCVAMTAAWQGQNEFKKLSERSVVLHSLGTGIVVAIVTM